MNYSKYRISLDIHDTNSQAMLNVKKDDTARKIYFNLTDGGRPYQIAEGCTAVFRAKKPDGTILYNNCTINDNVIEYTLTSQTSASVGIVECEVTLYGLDSRQITSPRFVFVVEDNLYSDSEIESQDEFTELTEAIANVSNLNASVNKTDSIATITITDKDGVDHTATVSDGVDGADGVGISSIEKTSTSENVDTYTITLTNGTTKTFTVTNGTDGTDGISITDAFVGVTGYLIITLSNGTSLSAGLVKGADGSDGADGENGTDGVSVTGVTINSSGHLIVTLSNGSTLDAGIAKGDSGVYIGDTQPTDPNVKVWIDTSGEAGDVEMTSNKVTSITSNSTDTEYPSAKSVYSLFSSITNARLIADIEITEDTSLIRIDYDLDNNPLRLKEAFFIFEKTVSNIKNANSYLECLSYNGSYTNPLGNSLIFSNSFNSSDNLRIYKLNCLYENPSGNSLLFGQFSYVQALQYFSKFYGGGFKTVQFRASGTNSIGIGTKVKVYGVDYC